MKRMVLALALLAVGTMVFAQVNLPEHRFVSGKWAISGQRLYQNDENARLAKVNIRAPQEGTMIYEFDALYEGGAEDGHGGFGLHVFVDAPYNEVSWGAGQSYLLWLNYDEKPINKAIPSGLSAQLYRSTSNSRMELVESYNLKDYEDLLTYENLAEPVPFKIIVNGNTGEVQVYDPTENNEYYYVLNLGRTRLKGDWVVLRTNGMRMSFSN